MIARVLFLLVGLVATGAGGFLGWLNRHLASSLFPADPAHAPWPLVGAVALLATGLACIGAGVAPQKGKRRSADVKSAEQTAALQAADTYYAARTTAPVTEHPADRDWRSADLPPVPPSIAATPPPPAPPPSVRAAPEPASAVPPPAPPPVVAAPPAATSPAQDDTPLGRIRAALAANRLEEADRLLADERNRLSGAGDGDPVALAMLTGLAGDHAAADGRVGGAKWLWRLALQRFAKADAMNSAEARAVAESLRLADQ